MLLLSVVAMRGAVSSRRVSEGTVIHLVNESTGSHVAALAVITAAAPA